MANDKTMTELEQGFIAGLAKVCKTHEDWLVLVRYGLGMLLENQPFLMQLIVMEAERLAEQEMGDEPTRTPAVKASDTVRLILKELGLRLVVAG